MIGNELSVILVGCHHVGLYAGLISLMGKCADDIICLIALHFKYGDMICVEYVLDDRNGKANCFRSFLSLCLIEGESLVPEGWTMWVESDTNVRWLFFGNDFLECVHKAKYG